ncbi:hypothetical protein Rgna01_00200 [Mediterraneibacter gnavus]|nr:hypothetical protein Rgna01_00200 [Mediterraneibacter gnavus]
MGRNEEIITKTNTIVRYSNLSIVFVFMIALIVEFLRRMNISKGYYFYKKVIRGFSIKLIVVIIKNWKFYMK